MSLTSELNRASGWARGEKTINKSDIPNPRDRLVRLPWLILVAGLITTVLVWYAMRTQNLHNGEQQFALHVREIVQSIEKRLYQHEQILLGGAGLFNARDSVTRSEWRIYIDSLRLSRNFPGIQGVGFSRVIAPTDLDAHIAAVRAEGFPDYVVKPSGKRTLYTAIVYLEPFSGRNLAAFGYDMFSQATRAIAMRRAGETGATAISGKVRLVQETHGKEQAGFLMYVPIYHRGHPALNTPAERWRALEGFVYSPYRVDDLMRGILGERNSGVDFSIHDGSEISDDTLMYNSASDHHADNTAVPQFSSTRQIQAYGHTWTISLHSLPTFEAQFQHSTEWVVLLLGFVISLLLAALTSSLVNRRERALELADAMTLKIREHEATLEESLQHRQAILDNVVDGIITIDAKGRIRSFNKAAERIFGYPASQTVYHNVKMLMPEPHHSAHDSYLKAYLDTGVAHVIGSGREVEGRRRDGSLFPMELSVSEIKRGDESLFIGLVRDITERKRIEKMKSEFVSTVSHELRTPLTSISGSLGLLVGGALGALPDPVKSLLDIAHKNSLSLSRLINDLLDLDKIAAGKINFDFALLSLPPLLNQAIEANRAYAEQHGVHFVLNDQSQGAQVRVDAQRLVQVLANLLSNAAKFSPAGAAVAVKAHRAGTHVRVEVTDYGPGIPDSFHDRIFQKFSQADSSDTRQKGGTGLGLAISRDLIEHMGGRIGFESTEGQGATFYFELPLGSADNSDVVDPAS